MSGTETNNDTFQFLTEFNVFAEAAFTPVDGSRQLGSNSGGKYCRNDGREFYLKFHPSKEEAESEVCTAKLYQLAGVSVPEVTLIKYFDSDGHEQYGIASAWDESFKPIKEEEYKLAHDGFIVDAWLNNWDVGSSANTGTVVRDRQRVVFRLDHKGGLDQRANPRGGQSISKTTYYGPWAFSTSVSALHDLRNPMLNPASTALFADIKDETLKAGVEQLAKLSRESIIKCVMQYGPGESSEKQALAEKLLARRQNLMMKHFVLNNELSKEADFSEIANCVIDALYRDATPGDTSYLSFYKNSSSYEEQVKRVKHGGMHASRVAALTDIFIHLYKKYDPRMKCFIKKIKKKNEDGTVEKVKLWDEEKVKMLKIAALFHDSGRASDAGGDCTTWEKKSRDLTRNCLENLGYEKRLSEIISEAIVYAEVETAGEDYKKYINQHYSEEEIKLLELYADILHDADSLDFLHYHHSAFDITRSNFYRRFVDDQDKKDIYFEDGEHKKLDPDNLPEEVKNTLQWVLAENDLNEIVFSHKTALAKMKDYRQGDIKARIDPSFSLATMAEYVHSGLCYSKVTETMCQQPGLAKWFDEFIKIPIRKEGDPELLLGEIIRSDESSKTVSPIGTSELLKDAKYKSFSLEQLPYHHSGETEEASLGKVGNEFLITLKYLEKQGYHRDGFPIVVIRGDKRSPEAIKAAGGMHPYCTTVTSDETTSQNKDQSPFKMAQGEKAPNCANVCSTVDTNQAAVYGSSAYLCITLGGLKRQNFSQQRDIPGGMDWQSTIGYRDNENICLRRSFIATADPAMQSLKYLLRKGDAIKLPETKHTEENTHYNKYQTIISRLTSEIRFRINKRTSELLVFEQFIRDHIDCYSEKTMGILLMRLALANVPLIRAMLDKRAPSHQALSTIIDEFLTVTEEQDELLPFRLSSRAIDEAKETIHHCKSANELRPFFGLIPYLPDSKQKDIFERLIAKNIDFSKKIRIRRSEIYNTLFETVRPEKYLNLLLLLNTQVKTEGEYTYEEAIKIIKLLPEQDRPKFCDTLLNIGSGHLAYENTISGYSLEEILRLLPEQYRLGFLTNVLGDDCVKALIKQYPHMIISLIWLLPNDQWQSYLTDHLTLKLAKEAFSPIKNYSIFFPCAAISPVSKIFQFHKLIYSNKIEINELLFHDIKPDNLNWFSEMAQAFKKYHVNTLTVNITFNGPENLKYILSELSDVKISLFKFEDPCCKNVSPYVDSLQNQNNKITELDLTGDNLDIPSITSVLGHENCVLTSLTVCKSNYKELSLEEADTCALAQTVLDVKRNTGREIKINGIKNFDQIFKELSEAEAARLRSIQLAPHSLKAKH